MYDTKPYARLLARFEFVVGEVKDEDDRRSIIFARLTGQTGEVSR